MDKAKIAKLCNEIEDIACDISQQTMNDIVSAESRIIFDKAKEITSEISAHPKTNADRIRQMTDDELSNGLHYIECARCGTAPHRLGAWDRETAVKYWNSVNRWISVEDALPEQGERVIVAIFGSDMIMPNEGETLQNAIERSRKEGYITVGFIGSDGWYGADWFPLIVQPSYWMPKPDLPEPPKE